jgi:hypothetical protein
MDSQTPADAYRSRLRDRQQTRQKLERWDQRIATFRGLVFFGFVILIWRIYAGDPISETWLLLPFGMFVFLISTHTRLRDSIERVERSIKHYQNGLDRLKGRWQGIGSDGDRYRDPEHPYANDLDLFGPGSMFELITRCQTRLGEDRLAAWFCHAANRESVLARQEAVRELADRVELRESLDVLHPPLKETADQNLLQSWVERPDRPRPIWLLVLVTIISIVAIGFLWGAFNGFPTVGPFLASLGTLVVLLLIYRSSLHDEIRAAEHMRDGLPVAVSVLRLIESQPYESQALQVIQQRLEVEGKPPSVQLDRLLRTVNLLSNCVRNQFLAPLAVLLGLQFHLTHRITRWKQTIGPHVAGWLLSIGEWEALLSLAGHHYEFPENVFPEIVDGGPIYVSDELRHPLLERGECVPNDIALDRGQKLWLVSGSNMSGKSTFLRTAGANAVLAYAGCSVHARSCRLSVMQLGAAMRVTDSLREGKSLFYTVVTRLKQIVDLTNESRYLFYLIDEILPGTNSHDRRLGAEGVLRSLVGRETLGLVTTHDLALTRIVDSLDGRAVNLHFEDHLEDGKMTFDYRLRPGVVKKSNALELMRMIGLDVVPEGQSVIQPKTTGLPTESAEPEESAEPNGHN